MPPGEYDESVNAAAAVVLVATFTVAICYYCSCNDAVATCREDTADCRHTLSSLES